MDDIVNELCEGNKYGESHGVQEKNFFKWTASSTKLLICERLSMENEFSKPTTSKKKLWSRIAAKMVDFGHFGLDGEICHSKYRNMLATYKKNKFRLKQNGNEAISWKYFFLFDEVLGHKYLNAHNEPMTLNQGENSSFKKTTPESFPIPPTSSLKAKLARRPDFLLKKIELIKLNLERKRKKWEEQKELEKESLKILSNLAKSFSDYNRLKERKLEHIKAATSHLTGNTTVSMPKYDGLVSYGSSASSMSMNNGTNLGAGNYKMMDQNMPPSQVDMDNNGYCSIITKESTANQVGQWLTYHSLSTYNTTFSQYSGSDILKLTKEDLIQICGLADGIRMFNTLHAKGLTPHKTIYVSLDGSSYHALYLSSSTAKELLQKLYKLPGFYEQVSNSTNMNTAEGNAYPGWGMHPKYPTAQSSIHDANKQIVIYMVGPSGVHVLVTDEVLSNVKDDSLFALEIHPGKVLMKTIYKNDN